MVSSATEGLRTKIKIANRSRSLTKENMENILENDTEMKYDRDSVITVISRDMLKEDVDSTTNYSNSDLESEVEIPIAFNADEDENIRRKSDIIINDSNVGKQQNTSSHLSKLFNQFYKPSNCKSEAEEDNTKLDKSKNDERPEFKSINGLVVQSEETSKNNIAIDNSNVQKESVPEENPMKTLEDDTYTRNISSEKKEIPVLDQILSDSQETNVKHEIKILDNTIQEKETGELEDNMKNSSNKTNNGNAGISDLKYDAVQKTAEETSKQFDKAKLLAAMKAIDDNENIEFVDQKTRRNSSANRLHITQNLYRGIPTHSKKKSDIMKELFADAKIGNNKSSKN